MGNPENLLNNDNDGDDGNSSEEEDILANSERYLEKSKNNNINSDSAEGPWQVDEKAAEIQPAAKGKRRVREIPQKKGQKNASRPARKKSDPDVNALDTEDSGSDSDGDNSKRKSLCGLLPKSKTAITTESSVAGNSMPFLMDSSFSSVHSANTTTDESVSSYLSNKKPGLIVASEVNDGHPRRVADPERNL